MQSFKWHVGVLCSALKPAGRLELQLVYCMCAGPVASARMASERYIWSVTPCLMLGSVLGIVYAVDR